MHLYQYSVKGDPQALLYAWDDAVAGIGKEEFFLHVVTTNDSGMTILDVCPTEEDFQGWINGDDWRAIKAKLGGEVEVTALGQVRMAVAREHLIGGLARRKVELLHKCFPSQTHRDWWDDEVFLGLARLRGTECRARYAEAFRCAKSVIAPVASDHGAESQ